MDIKTTKFPILYPFKRSFSAISIHSPERIQPWRVLGNSATPIERWLGGFH